MPIDPRIALGVQAPQIESPMNVMANALKLRAMQNENALFEQQQRQAAAQEVERNRLRGLLAGNATAADLRRAGFMDEASKLSQEERLGMAETRAQAEERRKAAEREQQVRELGYGFLSEAVDANSWRIVRRLAEKSGLPMDGVPGEDEYDPKWVEATRRVLGPELEFRDVGGGVAGLRKRTGETVSITQDIPKPEAVVRQDERVAAAGRAAPTPGQTKFSGQLGELAARQLDNLYTQAQSAESRLSLSNQLQPLLDNPEFISGTLGDARLAVAKMLGMEGAEETQAYFAGIGGQVAEIIKAFGAGTGLSDADRKFAEKIAGGSIELTPGAIRRIVRLNNDAAKLVISRYNRRRGELMQEEQEVGRFYPEVQPPSSGVVQVNTVEEARALPPGTRFKTPDGRIKVR